MTGHYRMARGWQAHEAFEGDEYSRRDAWVWMIERAAWRPTRHRIEGRFVAIERGQFAGSLRQMAVAWGWGHERVRRFLKLLVAEAMIETASETGKYIVSICNYEKYQATSSERETSSEPRARQQRDSNETLKKEGKEGKEDSEANASGASAPDPVKELWARGLAILGGGQRSLFGKLRKTYGDPVVLAAIVACEAECPSEPAAYLVVCCEQGKANGTGKTSAYDILAKAAIEFDERQGYRGPFETTH